MSERPLAAFSLTHVHYDPADPISLICAWLALLPQGLCIVYVTLIYTTREIEIALTFAGQLCCEALNWGLKRWIKEERPDAINVLGKGYGMPSSHAQFVGFYAVYVGLFLMWRHCPSSRRWVANTVPAIIDAKDGKDATLLDDAAATASPNGSLVVAVNGQDIALPETPENQTLPASPSAPPLRSALANAHSAQAPLSPVYTLQLHHPRLTHTILTLSTLGLALAVCASRIYLSYHTPRQVVVGFVVGVLFAGFWFSATEWARRQGWVEWLLEWTIIRRARIRDLVCEEDLVELGWQVWEEKRRRQRMLAGLGTGERKRRKSVTFKSGVEVVKPTTPPGGGAAGVGSLSGKKKKRKLRAR